jgi:hypothetical protein
VRLPNTTSHDYEIAFDAVQSRDAREFDGRSMPDGLCEQIRSKPALSKGFMNVQAYFCSLVIGRAPVEGRETQPSGNTAVQLGDP